MKKSAQHILNSTKSKEGCVQIMDRKIKKATGIVGVAAAVYIVLKYVLVYVAPFLVAFLIVRLLNPAAVKMQEYRLFRKCSKGSLIFCMMSLALGITGFLMWFLGARLFAQIRTVFTHIDQYEAKMEAAIDGCCSIIQERFGIESSSVRILIYQNMEHLSEKIQAVNITQIFHNSLRYAALVFEWAGAFFVVFVAVLLIIKDYDEICQKLQKYDIWRRAVHVGGRLWSMAGLWIRAQLLIMATIMAECVAGLWILGNSYALLVGILIGFMDALPFIGTGTILLPWAVLEVVRGDFFHAAAYVTLFLISNSTRDFMEPRLLGEKLGVYPIVIAVVVYAGICIFGPSGVLLGPLMLLVIREIIREWMPT